MARMISYAQNHEDVLLDRVFSDRTPGVYVDIGAWDPVIDSVTCHFYRRSWRGVNVEPNPTYLARLEKARPRDVNLGIAVSDQAGSQTLYALPGSGLSTLHPEVLVHDGYQPEDAQRIDVETTTLAALLDEHAPGPVDFLKIDVEGAEQNVLAGGDWERHRPTIVLVEATWPMSTDPAWEEWEPNLLAAGYTFVYFDGLNRFYVRDEDAALATHFRIPVGVVDDYVAYREDRLQRTVNRLRQKQRRRKRMRRWLPWVPRP